MRRRFTLLLATILLTPLPGCEEDRADERDNTLVAPALKTEDAPSKKEDLERFRGTWDGLRYVNERFGVAFDIPAEWTLQKTDFEDFKKKSLDATAGIDPRLRKEFAAAQNKGKMLFKTSHHPPGTPGKPNANIIVTVEDVSHFPDIQTGHDYLQYVQKSQYGARVSLDFQGQPTKVRLGEAEFYKWEHVTTLGLAKVHGTIYARVEDSIVFLMTSSYLTDELHTTVQQILRETSME